MADIDLEVLFGENYPNELLRSKISRFRTIHSFQFEDSKISFISFCGDTLLHARNLDLIGSINERQKISKLEKCVELLKTKISSNKH